MQEQFERTGLLLGVEAVESLAKKRVAVFGVGGVGGYVCEALVRSGIGIFDLIDKDVVDITNMNRQIIATIDTIGKYKTEVMAARMKSINPSVEVNVRNLFFLPENADTFPFSEYDYVVDAVDTVTAKIAIIMRAKEAGVPVISSMGAGNKLDPSGFKVADIYKTNVCPLAKVMRRELKNRGIKNLKVVYSEEIPVKRETKAGERKVAPGSVAWVPSVAGLTIAGEVVRDLTAGPERYYKPYGKLMHALVDMAEEAQAKLGYEKGEMGLYYPLTSLNHFFDADMDAEEMQAALEGFPKYLKKRYGGVTVSHKKDRFCFLLDGRVAEQVHLLMKPDAFIGKLVDLMSRHGTTLAQIEELFKAQSSDCEICELEGAEFDVMIRFEEGPDPYYYCFKDEGCHVTYHRFLPADYREIVG